MCETCSYGYAHQSFALHPQHYLMYLTQKFIRNGGHIIRSRINHILDPLIDPNVVIIVNCTGNGARTLGGVQDILCYPIRGQTVLVNAPDVKKTITQLGKNVSYIIPRPDGNVILGGTRDSYSWVETPSLETEARIIQDCVTMCPQLVKHGFKTVDIVGRGVGFRPGRIGGPRIEANPVFMHNDRRKCIVAHNYGHASYGTLLIVIFI